MASVFAIVVAAGEGERLQRSLSAESSNLSSFSTFQPKLPTAPQGAPRMIGGTSKVSLELADGKSILDYSINNLWQSGVFDGIVIVARPEDISGLKAHLLGGFFASGNRSLLNATESIRPDIASYLEFVEGGASRQESVFNGLESVKGRASYVAVHDGARPFCRPQAVASVVSSAQESGAALLATRIVPTIKRQQSLLDGGCADVPFTVRETVWRGDLWEAQTPQAFRFELIYQAHLQARREGFEATDDAELVERLGFYVTLVESSRMNFKITNSDDFRLAQLLVSQINLPTANL